MIEVTIRRSRASDAKAIHEIRTDPETRRYQPLVPGTVEALRETLAERGARLLVPTQARKVQWTILAGGEIAGWVAVDITHRNHKIASLGYTVARRFHGQGIASAAVQQALPAIFDPKRLDIERLEAVAAVDNIASCRVMEKCGLTFEGIARGYLILSGTRVDHAMYARLRTDPGASPERTLDHRHGVHHDDA